MKRGKPESRHHALGQPVRLGSLEALEARLESQLVGPAQLDDESCLYYLCTSRCSETKCMALMEAPE